MTFERLGAWIYRRRWLTLAASTLFLALAVATLVRGGQLTGPTIHGIESDRAQAVVEQVLGHTMDTTLIVILRAEKMDPRNQDFQAAVHDALEPLRHDADVASVMTADDVRLRRSRSTWSTRRPTRSSRFPSP